MKVTYGMGLVCGMLTDIFKPDGTPVSTSWPLAVFGVEEGADIIHHEGGMNLLVEIRWSYTGCFV